MHIAFLVALSHHTEGADHLWLKTELSLQITHECVLGVQLACQAIQSTGITHTGAMTVANGTKTQWRDREKTKYLCKQLCISNMSCKNTLKRFSFISRWFKTTCLFLRCDAFNSLIKNHKRVPEYGWACMCVFPHWCKYVKHTQTANDSCHTPKREEKRWRQSRISHLLAATSYPDETFRLKKRKFSNLIKRIYVLAPRRGGEARFDESDMWVDRVRWELNSSL